MGNEPEKRTETHDMEWKSGGPGRTAYEDYRWECTCGFRPRASWPHLEADFAEHVEAELGVAVGAVGETGQP